MNTTQYSGLVVIRSFPLALLDRPLPRKVFVFIVLSHFLGHCRAGRKERLRAFSPVPLVSALHLLIPDIPMIGPAPFHDLGTFLGRLTGLSTKSD